MTRLLVVLIVSLCTLNARAWAQETAPTPTPEPTQPFNYYNPYGYSPYGFGWGGSQEQSQGEEGTEGELGTRYWPYDPALRGLVPHPNMRDYGPGGDPRLTYDRRGEGAFTPGQGTGVGDIFPLPPGVHLGPGERWKTPKSLNVSFDRLGEKAALRLSAPTMAGLCGTAGPIEYDLGENPPWLDLKIKGYRVSGEDRKDCKPGDRFLRVDIPLEREQLERSTQIRIALGGEINTYNIRRKDNVFALEPLYTPNVAPLTAESDFTGLAHEYVNGGVVALFVPAAAADEDVSQQVLAFAARKGLTPVRDTTISMPAYVHGNRAWYFVDPSGAVARAARTGPSGVGSIMRSRPVLGPQGTVHESEPAEIYASVPPGR